MGQCQLGICKRIIITSFEKINIYNKKTNMSIINEPQRTDLYTKVRHLLGAPLRSVELEDEQLDSLLEFSIDDYSQYIQDWLIESQWSNLWGLNVETQSLAKAFITKSLDFETRYTYAY